MSTASAPALVTHHGSCHCEQVRLEVDAPEDLVVQECNCSMCSRLGFLHLIVPRSRFRLVAGRERLTLYTFHTGVAQHTFCSMCGVKPFYVPRSHPEGFSVNARCLSPASIRSRVVVSFDGAHWEEHVAELPPLSPASGGTP